MVHRCDDQRFRYELRLLWTVMAREPHQDFSPCAFGRNRPSSMNQKEKETGCEVIVGICSGEDEFLMCSLFRGVSVPLSRSGVDGGGTKPTVFGATNDHESDSSSRASASPGPRDTSVIDENNRPTGIAPLKKNSFRQIASAT